MENSDEIDKIRHLLKKKIQFFIFLFFLGFSGKWIYQQFSVKLRLPVGKCPFREKLSTRL